MSDCSGYTGMVEEDWFKAVGERVTAYKIHHGWKVTTPADWADPNEIPAVLAMIHSEVSEALEAFRKDDRANFDDELADVAIRLIGLCHGMEIDLKSAVHIKLKKNDHREHRHGGKRI